MLMGCLLKIFKDIELLKARNDELRFSYPYILLVCSCIDLFGDIEKGFKSSTKERFTWFIIGWMSKVTPLYKENDLASLIYDSWRCGVVHQATLKKGFETSSYMYSRDKHLYYIQDNERVFIHSLQFADDLIEAQKMYREYINDSVGDEIYIGLLYKHLLEMMGDETKQCFDQFIKYLQNNNLVFNSTDNIATHTTTVTPSKSSKETTTCLPNEDILSAVPSAAPEEDDLK